MRRLNQLPNSLQSNIRLDQSNIGLTRIELKFAAFNWFRRRILHAFNLAIRFGACKKQRLNQALQGLTYCIDILGIVPRRHLTIIPWARVGYEMIDSQRGA